MLPWKENDRAPIEDLLHWHFFYFKLDQDNLHRPTSHSKPIKDLLLWYTPDLKLVEDLLHWYSWIGILAGFFVSFGSWIGILAGFFVSFGSSIEIPGRPFVSFVSWMGIPGRSFMSFSSWIGILDGFFASFGSWMWILTGFLLLRARHKSDLYKDRLIFYRGSVALHGFGYVVVSRKDSSFLSLMKEKKQKKIKAMIAIYFYLVHVIHGRCLVRLGEERAILAKFLLLKVRPNSDLYKDRMIFYRDSAALYRVGYVVASRNGSSFLSLMKEKKQKKIKAMIAISFCLVHVVNGRCLVRLGEGRSIFAGELLLCSLYMRKKCLHFFSIVLGVCFKNMF